MSERLTPIPADQIAEGMLAALDAGTVSSEMSDVWARGHNRTYDGLNIPATRRDPDVAPTHRRHGRDHR